MPESQTGGVKPMTIAGRTVRERERLLGMSTEERAWRAQWLKDQHLAPNEPVFVPEYYRELVNPIRRMYRAPLDKFGELMKPIIGDTSSYVLRYLTGKAIMGVVLLYAGAYYFKYNANDWTRRGGWRVISSKSTVDPGDSEFPKLSDRSKPSDYADRGFKNASI